MWVLTGLFTDSGFAEYSKSIALYYSVQVWTAVCLLPFMLIN